ncbi:MULTISPECIES: hypothetical protein [unclassified Rhizobium]|nr:MULTISPECIES: hypothetical protein [unclassified Rhizobium]
MGNHAAEEGGRLAFEGCTQENRQQAVVFDQRFDRHARLQLFPRSGHG